MFRQDRTNPSTAISNWRGRHDTPKGWPSTAVSTWLNGGLFGGAVVFAGYLQTGGQYVLATKYDFLTETYAAIGSAITNIYGSACTNISNNQVMGYSVSGMNKDSDPTGRSRRSWRISVPADVCSEVGATTTVLEHMGGFGCSNSGTAGYYGGGHAIDPNSTNTIEKFSYSSDTSVSVISGVLNDADGNICAMAKSGDRGLVVNRTGLDYVHFATDTVSAGTATSVLTYGGVAISNGQVAGYASGGYSLGSAIDRYDYSTFTRTTLSATAKTGYVSGWGNTGVAAYIAQNATVGNQSKLDFSTETTSTPSGSMGDSFSGNSLPMCFSTCEASP